MKLSPDPLHRDDRPIPRKGRPLISPIGMNLFLLAAGPGFARIPFYTGFTKKGGTMQNYVNLIDKSWLSNSMYNLIGFLRYKTVNLSKNDQFLNLLGVGRPDYPGRARVRWKKFKVRKERMMPSA